MSERLWYPVELIDEVLPPGRMTPEVWLAPEIPGEPDVYDRFMAPALQPGNRLSFKWVQHLPWACLEINADGTLVRPGRCPETPDMFTGEASPGHLAPPPSANTFYDPETECFAETAEEFARLYAVWFDRDGRDDAQTASVSVQCAHWSKTIHFTINADGKSLTPIEAKEADS